MNWTFGLSLASLIYGVLFFVLTIALLGTPVTDVGMLSTTAVFVLLGVFGLLATKSEKAEAA